MCGIAALFSTTLSSKEAISYVKKMGDLIRHRGPDDEGYAIFPLGDSTPALSGGPDTPSAVLQASFPYTTGVGGCKDARFDAYAALGHRRLSIIDLSPAGHQPMCTRDQRYWLVYNGEIYNYLEIRQELARKGHSFFSHTDTEVILKAYQEWGVECLDHFNGMFAFVILDTQERRFFAARDRFGVKPLYYWKNPSGVLAFASEIKQFTVLPRWNPRMNHQRSYDFLNWGVTDHTDETLFVGVKQLRGGHYILASLDSIESRKLQPKQWYWLRPKPYQGSFEEASAEFTDLLRDSVGLRLRADVDVGSCLSGGLDSSSIVCLANDLLRQKNAEARQKTFSAYSDISRFDERHYIELVANQMNVEAHSTVPCPDIMESLLPEIVWHQDEPYGSTSIYAQWLVFELAKKNRVKVMLDGQGADEQLAGYLPFFGCRFYDLFSTLRWKLLFQEMAQTRQLHQSINPLFMLARQLVPFWAQQPLRYILKRSACNPEWLDFDRFSVQNVSPLQHFKEKRLSDQSYLQLMHSSLPMLLHFEDRDSMAHSIESRTPFLDYRLVEFNLGLPGDYKISQGWTKRVLRSGTEGIMPNEIRHRIDKIGFATAEEEWLTKRRPDIFRQWTRDAIDASQGVLTPKALELVEDIIAGKRPFSFLPWRMICFGHWIKRFSVKL